MNRIVSIKMKPKYILLLLLIPLSVLALALRGAVQEKTYVRSEIPASAVQVAIVSYNTLSKQSLKVDSIPGDATFISGDEPFQAVIIELPHHYKPDESYSIRWAAVTYTLTSNSEFEYVMFLLSRDGELPLDAEGPVFLSHATVFIDIYRLDATLDKMIPSSEELTLVWPFLSNFSIVIIKKGFEPSGFLMFKLNSIELMYSNESIRSDLILDPRQIALMAVGMIAVVIVAPTVLWALPAFRPKPSSTISGNIFLMIPLAYGILSRIVVAPFTGHPYDMEVWTQMVRLFYESGVIDVRTSPMPLTYYLLLLAYSPYALLRTLGLQDMMFLAHKFRMVEAVFIKAPFISSDILSLYFLLKILNKLGSSKPNPHERFAHAFMYFLNPLAIILSGVWGMCDGIAVALFLAGIYYALLEEKPFHGALSYALSGLTKAFGFIGLIPLAVASMRERKFFQLLAMLSVVSAIAVLLYMPLLTVTGIQAVPELFVQFLRGRSGLGSKPPYIASASYMSYLSISGLNIEPPRLTYLLITLIVLISVYYGSRMRNSMNEAQIGLTLRYVAMVFLIFYLTFFRVYEQYYLWVIPILIIYSYLIEASGPAFIALCISLVVSPTLLLGALLVGTEHYWIPLNLPADATIVATLPSTLAALGLISIVDMKEPLAVLKTGKGMLASAGLALWFSFGLAYYIYYGVPFLGVLWYLTSLMIFLTAAALLYRKLRPKRVESLPI